MGPLSLCDWSATPEGSHTERASSRICKEKVKAGRRRLFECKKHGQYVKVGVAVVLNCGENGKLDLPSWPGAD